ncbi:Mannan endo-1,6-alpha-mannosidase-like protein [Hapsidospora chrysogenum ATCC 11550]|uniref:Mannan endo-1,6-alpha-mannosidase-like protein n=1 Tax=Hapsidospora chrysogenum (strain ATCC 11550 / CBS 779.69 / DSM 880 / IAM 14645 / JCM 23072 / IMI 49137) TaxID=857340 RepID=A0A086T0I2_HAPC1|nr:Mannan endo-1,6-alpha-mannosidase-like protein [Hapsidospora chrysogenum ATCC 11550]
MGWNTGLWDWAIGVGEQMSALEVTLGCMIRHRDPILRADNGGTSQSDPGAGTQSKSLDPKSLDPLGRRYGPITTLDRVGGSFTTAIIIGLLVPVFFGCSVMRTGPGRRIRTLLAGHMALRPGQQTPRNAASPPILSGKQAAEDTKDTMHQRPRRKLKFFWRLSSDPSIRSGEVMELDNLQAAHQSTECSGAPCRMNGAVVLGPYTKARIRG